MQSYTSPSMLPDLFCSTFHVCKFKMESVQPCLLVQQQDHDVLPAVSGDATVVVRATKPSDTVLRRPVLGVVKKRDDDGAWVMHGFSRDFTCITLVNDLSMLPPVIRTRCWSLPDMRVACKVSVDQALHVLILSDFTILRPPSCVIDTRWSRGWGTGTAMLPSTNADAGPSSAPSPTPGSVKRRRVRKSPPSPTPESGQSTPCCTCADTAKAYALN